MRAVTHAGHTYGVPHDIDLAALFYNKDLFIRAGLDGDRPPANLRELHEFAAKLNGLGGGVHGFNFGGACPDCMFATAWPMIWASGSKVLNDDGTAALLNSPDATRVFEFYRPDVRRRPGPPCAKNESGPSWTQAFSEGLVGIQPMGATALRNIEEASQLQVGVAAIPGLEAASRRSSAVTCSASAPTARTPTRRGTSSPGRCRSRRRSTSWRRTSNVTVRSDLDGNVYAQQDPRLVTFTQLARKGQTPYAVASARPSTTRTDRGSPPSPTPCSAPVTWVPPWTRHNVSITAIAVAEADAVARVTGGPPVSFTPLPMAVIVAVLFVGPLGLVVWMSLNDWPLLGASAPNGVANYDSAARPAVRPGHCVHPQVHRDHHRAAVGWWRSASPCWSSSRGPAVAVFRTVFFLPAAVGFASASLLFYGMFNQRRRRRSTLLAGLSATDGRRLARRRRTTRCSPRSLLMLVALRRAQHADPADRPAVDRPAGLRGGPHRRRHPLADLAPRSRCRCCAPPSRWC